MYRQFGKRLLDVAVASAGLLILSPVLLILSGLARWKLGSPVFFRQARAGLYGRSFCIVKFRTMTDARDSDGNLLPDAERLTPFGHFLRAFSLDELPELWNVFVGEMSLVGPRPLYEEYLPLYSAGQARRHDVRPGITGWAQINGRNRTTWEERFERDIWYVDNLSMPLDLEILARTAWKVVRRDGISADDHATMARFMGARR